MTDIAEVLFDETDYLESDDGYERLDAPFDEVFLPDGSRLPHVSALEDAFIE